MKSPWLLLQSGRGESAWNMALDEALLEGMPRLGRPVLRFYGWTEPAASFGYFQAYAEVAALTSLRPLVRRPTAGGIVPHDADWTYSIAFPVPHEWYSLRAIESYRRLHTWLQNAFGRLGIETHLAPEALRSGPGQCFAGHEQFDLLWRGRKLAGAAQRRRLDGLLIQGSVQPSGLGLNRADWEKAMTESARAEYGADWTRFELDLPTESRARELAAQKYSREAYSRKK